jgi:hypothetical protein
MESFVCSMPVIDEFISSVLMFSRKFVVNRFREFRDNRSLGIISNSLRKGRWNLLQAAKPSPTYPKPILQAIHVNTICLNSTVEQFPARNAASRASVCLRRRYMLNYVSSTTDNLPKQKGRRSDFRRP